MSAYEFLQVHSHELEPDPEVDETTIEESTNEVVDSKPPDTLLVNGGAISTHSHLEIYDECYQRIPNAQLI
jgi:hypothetical protein